MRLKAFKTYGRLTASEQDTWKKDASPSSSINHLKRTYPKRYFLKVINSLI